MKFSVALTAAALVSTFCLSSLAQEKATKAYFLEFQGQRLTQTNPDGSGRTVLFSGIGQINSIAVDPSKQLMYWTNTSSGLIQRARTNGLQLQTVLSGLRSPRGIAIDPVAGKVYWGEQDLPLLKRANLDGSGMEQLVSENYPFGHRERSECATRGRSLARRGRAGAGHGPGCDLAARQRLGIGGFVRRQAPPRAALVWL